MALRHCPSVQRARRDQLRLRAGHPRAGPEVAAAGGPEAGARKGPPTQPNGEDDFFAFFRRPAKKDGGGLTPLVYAARQDCMECAKDAGRSRRGRQPAHAITAGRRCWWRRRTGIINSRSTCWNTAPNPNIANNGGWTPLYLATDNRNIEGGDYPVRTPDMDHLDFIKLLIAKGANVNARICGVESTPEECKGDSTETRTNFTMQWLFEDGATPFLRAAQSGDVELMKLLLAHGANPKIYTAHNVTPLAVASGIGWVEGVTFEWSPEENLEAVKMCLDLGIDPNVDDDEGRTALHGAAHKGRLAVIQTAGGPRRQSERARRREPRQRQRRAAGQDLDSAGLGARLGPRGRSVGDCASGSRGAARQADDRNSIFRYRRRLPHPFV